MMRLSRSLAAGLTLLGAAPAAAQAGAGGVVSFGVLAGGSLPTGQFSRGVYDAGYHLGALAESRTPVRWLHVRVEGAYQRLDAGRQTIVGPDFVPRGTVDVHTSVVSAAGNVVVRMPGEGAALRPYLVGGLGAYRLQYHARSDSPLLSSADGPREWETGMSAGLGLDVAVRRASVFAEARYQRIGHVLRLVPISVGLRLR